MMSSFAQAVAAQLIKSRHNKYGTLPHRDVTGVDILSLEHRPCEMPLKVTDIEANWCPHCAATINKAAKQRGEQHRRGS
jgi:hypothetical protein